eukprot:Gb_06724 [translate_table: standard]
MMEWWYQSAEERIAAPTVYPPPPPPPPPKVAEEGIPLPLDRTLCPLCSQKRINPTLVAVSGFVFCYPCIHKYISQYKRCPVTLMPATVDQIQRLFHDRAEHSIQATDSQSSTAVDDSNKVGVIHSRR